MSEQPITHQSAQKTVPQSLTVLESSNKSGVKCDWKGNYLRDGNGYNVGSNLCWTFDWSELKKTGVDELSGHIIVTCPSGYFTPTKVYVDLTNTSQTIQKFIYGSQAGGSYVISYEYSLIPYRTPVEKVSYDEMFLPSDVNDTILLIGEKKLHVNRGFLSTHSEFFRALFSSNFKEGQMDEIPIQDVSYEDFHLMMSTIYPKTVYPNDSTVEKLLELSDRFIIKSIIGHVEYHLIHNSKISSEKKMWFADAYGMPKLLEKCLRELNTLEKAKALEASPEYKKLSNDAKSRVLDKLMKLIRID